MLVRVVALEPTLVRVRVRVDAIPVGVLVLVVDVRVIVLIVGMRMGHVTVAVLVRVRVLMRMLGHRVALLIYERMLMLTYVLMTENHGPAAIDAETARKVAEAMQALSTPSRVRILGQLRESPCSVGDLAAAVDMEPSAVSHQLRMLRHLGLVIGRRKGRSVVYALHDSHVGLLLEEAVYHVEHTSSDRSAVAR